MAFEHQHHLGLSGQSVGGLGTLVAFEFLPHQACKLARMRGQRARSRMLTERQAGGGQCIEPIGVDDHRAVQLPIQSGHQSVQSVAAPQSRPAGHHRGCLGKLHNGPEGLAGNAPGWIVRQRGGHVGGFEACHNIQTRRGHRQAHQPCTASQSCHARQCHGPGHAPRTTHDQRQAEVAFVRLGCTFGQVGQFVGGQHGGLSTFRWQKAKRATQDVRKLANEHSALSVARPSPREPLPEPRNALAGKAHWAALLAAARAMAALRAIRPAT